MYRFISCYRLFNRQLILSLVTIVASTSCSILSDNSSRSIALASKQEIDWKLERIGAKGPHIYRRSPGEDSPHRPMFATAIKECNKPTSKLSRSIEALTRQLFVGIDSLEVLQQEELESEWGRILWWVVAGEMEGRIVHISSYSVVHNRCLLDFVLWSFPLEISESDQHSNTVLFKQEAEAFREVVFHSLRSSEPWKG